MQPRSRKIFRASFAPSFSFTTSETTFGACAMLVACLLGAFTGAGFYQAHILDPAFSPTAGMFVRALANFSCLLLPLLRREPLPKIKPWRGHRSLWLWALLGVLSTTTYYLALPLVGCGLLMFLNAGSGIFIAALAPYLCKQSTSRAHWVGAVGSFMGLYFLTPGGNAGPGAALGTLLSVLSGFFGGLAFLMVARTKKTCCPESVMLHWAVLNLVAYSGFLFFFPPLWPSNSAAWIALVLGSLCGAASQYFSAIAYQKAPASLAACLCYLAPVLAVCFDAVLFGFKFSLANIAGALIVMAFGLGLPLVGLARKQTLPNAAID